MRKGLDRLGNRFILATLMFGGPMTGVVTASGDIALVGVEGCVPNQQPTSGPRADRATTRQRGERLSVRSQQFGFGGECDPVFGRRGWREELDVLDATPVPPEVDAADVAEAEPNTGVHCGVIGGVFAANRRMIARDLDAVRTMHVGEIRTENLRVAEDIFGQRPLGVLHRQTIRLEIESKLRVGGHDRFRALIV